MSKQKASAPPPAPEFQAEPNVQPNINRLSELGGRLTSFDFSGELSPLQQTIDLDPEVTRLALQFAENSLNPAFRRQRQNTINELANLGALESSTTANALANIDFDLASQLQGITAGAALEDRSRALQNRIGLFGTGLNTLQSATGLGLEQQGQLNVFEQQNFINQLSLQELGKDNRGGLFGGLTGAFGGAATGASFGGAPGAIVGGIAGGLAGAFGPSGTGGQVLNAGAILSASRARPSSTAGAGRDIINRGISTESLEEQLRRLSIGGGLGGFALPLSSRN